MRKRIYFEKKGEMKYISNFDLARFLERLFKISGISIEYTGGFSPRPKMSFGNPLSIGEEAHFEPFDVTIIGNDNNEKIKEKLNSKVPRGFKILKVEDIDKKSVILDDFGAIEYEIIFEESLDREIFSSLINREEIIEEKKDKKGRIKRRNLKEKIVSWSYFGEGLKITLENVSPNAYFRMLEIDMTKIIIKRLSYVNI
jgi:radical SAM-linked protein